MPFNPKNQRSITKLIRQVRASRDLLSDLLRKGHEERVQQMVGKHYGRDGAPERVPVNLLEMMIGIYMRKLIARRPRALVTTKNSNLKWYASTLRVDLDHAIKEVNLERAAKRATKNALLTTGFVKMGIKLGDVGGARYVRSVSPSDWVHDINARHFEEALWVGNTYREPLSSVRNNEEFDEEVRSTVQPTHRGEDGGTTDGPENITAGDGLDTDDSYGQNVELQDIFLRDEQLLVTYPAAGTDRLLRTMEWEGPKHGPYHMLAFSEVPDNVLPLAPSHLAMDIHELANQLFNKAGMQAGNQKTVLAYHPGAAKDVQAIVNAEDGATIQCSHLNQIKEFSFGGLDQRTLAMFLQNKDLFSWLMGNLDILGGLGPQSETATQDQMMGAAASERLADMQKTETDFIRAIVEDLAYYEWEDPQANREVSWRLPGTEIDITDRRTWADRPGHFSTFEFDIVPYSMLDRTPAQRAQSLMSFIQGFVMPIMPVLQAQGITINWATLFELYADYMDQPELNDILRYSTGQQTQRETDMHMAPMTTRVNERVNRGGGTTQGRDAALMQTLLGAGTPQGAAMLSRGVG